jgi:membrane-associated protein
VEFIQALISLLQDPMSSIAGWIEQGQFFALGLIFLIIFIETGVVFMPFLPGDSLLFAAGVFAHLGSLPLWELLLVVWAAAILGDQCNFFIGHFLGKKIIASGKVKALTPERIAKSEAFMEKWGGLSIFLGRFFPFIRTFVPFLAGVGGMRWHHFFGFNVLGGIVWSSVFTLLGFWFGGIQVVQDHFELLVIGIVLISVIPTAVGIIKSYLNKKKGEKLAEEDLEHKDIESK